MAFAPLPDVARMVSTVGCSFRGGAVHADIAPRTEQISSRATSRDERLRPAGNTTAAVPISISTTRKNIPPANRVAVFRSATSVKIETPLPATVAGEKSQESRGGKPLAHESSTCCPQPVAPSTLTRIALEAAADTPSEETLRPNPGPVRGHWA